MQAVMEMCSTEPLPVPPMEPIEPVSVYAFREDARFQSSNPWGLPDLRSDRLADVVPSGTWTGEGDPAGLLVPFRSAATSRLRGAVLCFYVPDWRFESVWAQAVRTVSTLHAAGLAAVVAPDFSMWRDDPLAVQLWNLYRSRWVARYWQEAGINVIPNLQFADERTLEFAFAGMPVEAPVMAVECRTLARESGADRARWVAGVERGLAALCPRRLLIYGGAEHRGWIEPAVRAHETELIYLGAVTDGARKRQKKETKP
jgi:hypothetical protein